MERSLSRRPSDTRGNLPNLVAVCESVADRPQPPLASPHPTNQPRLCYSLYKSPPHPRNIRNYNWNLILKNMAMLALRPVSNGFSTPPSRKRIPKVEGDISSVFASLAGDKTEALPARFAELKREIMGEHGDAILASWKRLIPIVEAKVREANERGPSIFPEIQFADIVNNNVDDKMIERIKRTGVCIIRNAIPQTETTEILADVRKYIKANPTTKGTSSLAIILTFRLPCQRSSNLGTLLVSQSTSSAIPPKYANRDDLAQHSFLPHSQS